MKNSGYVLVNWDAIELETGGLSIEQAARSTGLSEKTIRRMMSRKQVQRQTVATFVKRCGLPGGLHRYLTTDAD